MSIRCLFTLCEKRYGPLRHRGNAPVAERAVRILVDHFSSFEVWTLWEFWPARQPGLHFDSSLDSDLSKMLYFLLLHATLDLGIVWLFARIGLRVFTKEKCKLVFTTPTIVSSDRSWENREISQQSGKFSLIYDRSIYSCNSGGKYRFKGALVKATCDKRSVLFAMCRFVWVSSHVTLGCNWYY